MKADEGACLWANHSSGPVPSHPPAASHSLPPVQSAVSVSFPGQATGHWTGIDAHVTCVDLSPLPVQKWVVSRLSNDRECRICCGCRRRQCKAGREEKSSARNICCLSGMAHMLHVRCLTTIETDDREGSEATEQCAAIDGHSSCPRLAAKTPCAWGAYAVRRLGLQ